MNTWKKEIAALKAKLQQAIAEKNQFVKQHQADINQLRNGYQKEIAAAIRRAEAAEKKCTEHEQTIERQKQKITALDRKVNPQRYRLSSRAELIGHRFFSNNPYTVTLKIWTKVKDVEHTEVAYLCDNDERLIAFGNGDLTEHEFVNACFDAAEQINEAQAHLLDATIYAAMGGEAQAHIGTGGGGSNSGLPWRDRDKDKRKYKGPSMH